MALAIVPLMPFLGALRPLFRPEATFVTVAKAFLLLLNEPGLPKLLDFFTAAMPALIALLNLLSFFLTRFLGEYRLLPGHLRNDQPLLRKVLAHF